MKEKICAIFFGETLKKFTIPNSNNRQIPDKCILFNPAGQKPNVYKKTQKIMCEHKITQKTQNNSKYKKIFDLKAKYRSLQFFLFFVVFCCSTCYFFDYLDLKKKRLRVI